MAVLEPLGVSMQDLAGVTWGSVERGPLPAQAPLALHWAG